MSEMSWASTGANEDASTLASELTQVADTVIGAATYADGEYIPQLTREDELSRAFSVAGCTAALLERLAPRIARLAGGEDAIRLAQTAINDVDTARRALQEGVVVEYDLLRNGTVVIDAIATGTAGALLRDAASAVRDIADIATLEATGVDDLFAAIVRS